MRNENKEQVEFWSKVWQEASDQQRIISADTSSRNNSLSMWNSRAESYARNSAGKAYETMQKTVLEYLNFCDIDLIGAKILDIGCGPGNYTIRLAEKAASVWALDPVEAMLDIVKTRADEAGLDNINYVNRSWEEIDLGKENWIGKFDLVFASMTPGVMDKETLDKVIAASKGFCYVSRFSGKRRNNLQEKLWPILSQEPAPWTNQAMDIIYPLNLLYAMGYFPCLKFINSRWVHNEDIEKTTTKLMDGLAGNLDITPEIVATVREFVAEQAVDGIVTEEGEANMGLMVWKI